MVKKPFIMKKSFLPLFFLLLGFSLAAQTKVNYSSTDLIGFNKAAAWQKAQQKSAKPAEQKEYFESLVRQYVRSKKQQGAQVINSTVPFSINKTANRTIINLSPQNAYCPNADFGNANFTNWQGGTYSNSLGTNWNSFTPAWTPGIVTMGNNTPTQPAVSWAAPTPKPNRHTILTIPPTVNNPPANCIGWDSIAVGMSHLSEIPFVPPTAGGVTCRLGNANNDYETENLVYTMNVSAANAQFTYAYAVVLYDGGHLVGEQPFFKVTMKDQAGNLIAGCGQYQIDATLVSTDTSFFRASQYDSFSSTWTDGYTTGTTPNINWYYDVYYKKWTSVGVDLTGYIGQNVTIEFQTADCIYGGHWGYAYIDANCGPTQALVNMCNGNTTQQILGPNGYVSYQWYGPNSPTAAIAAPNGTNDTLFVNNGVVGDVYYLTAFSANGCTTYLQATLAYSSVGIQYTSNTPSCPGGFSGSATVYPIGSPSYGYTWLNSAGLNVGNAQTATGLSPGTYSVHVTAPGCGSHDTTVTVGIAPPITTSTSKNFCGSAAYLTVPTAGATNIQWYNSAAVAVPAPAGSNDTLLVTGASNGQTYAVVYTSSGCIDSLRITLSQVAGGSLNHSNIQNVCVGASNGQATVSLNTTAVPPYNYTMTGPCLNQTYTGVSQTSYSLTGLCYGTYTVNAFDGTCFYVDAFKIDTIPIPVYLTVAPKALCSSDSAFISYVFGGAPPTQCQLSTSGCVSSSTHLVGPANASNFSSSYPTPFGNWYTNMKAQYIYTAAELNAAGINAGKISSIAFNCTQIFGATTYPNFNISLGCTAQSTYSMFPAYTDVIPGLTNVYNNANYNVTLGQNTFTFTQPYEWDGVSNLVVEVCFEFPGQFNFTSNCVVDNTTTTNYTSISVLSDTDPMCAGFTALGSYWAQSAQMRPVATFGWCSSVATPAMYTYSLTPNTGVLNAPINPPTTTILQPSSTTSYTFTTTSVVGGCAKKDTFTISIVAPFVIHMPPVASFCSNGTSTPINATFTDPVTGAPIVTPGVWTGPGITANNGTGGATFNPATAGVGTHTLVMNAGGSGCGAKDSVVYTVMLWQSGHISTPDSLFCIYDPSVQIIATTAGGTWSGPVSATGLFTPSTAGISSPYHTIKYVVNGGTLCPDSSTVQVKVFAQPTVNFTADTTQGCAPNVSINFTAIVAPPGGTYHWNFGGGQTSTFANPQNIYATAGVYSPELTYTDLNGCKDSITKVAYINIHAWQTAKISIADSIFCITDPSMLITATTPGGTWSGPVSSNGLFNPSIAGVTSNLTPPYVTVKHYTNAGTACPDSAMIHIEVFNKPLVNFTTDTTEGCEPSVGINFTANVSPLGGTYKWNFNNGQISSAANPQNVYVLPGTYSPKLTYIDPNGCHDSITKSALIIVHPAPNASFYANPNHTTILEPHIEFTNTSTGTNNTWLWNISNVKFVTTRNTNFDFEDPGLYMVTLTATNNFGCKDSAIEYIKVDPDNMLYVPSGFTPNFDGKNDVFMAEAFGIFDTEGFKMSVFDRWGTKLFESGDIYKGWDGMKAGQVLQEDTYVYSVSYKDSTGKMHTKTGQVSLIK
jgi:gliding motility-associated-like protein